MVIVFLLFFRKFADFLILTEYLFQSFPFLLYMGFLKPELPQLPENAFIAGDAATGPSLVVRCIDSGRKAAVQIDSFLKKQH